jgi:hypothetical protein
LRIKIKLSQMRAFGDALPEAVDLNQDAGGIQSRRIVDTILAAERDGTLRAV